MSTETTLLFDFAAITDIGCMRSNNEDSYGYDAEQQIYVVCDGMGGTAAGEIASSIAVRALIETFGLSNSDLDGNGPIEDRLMRAILEANRSVRKAGSANPELRSMGTTLVCVCLEGDRVVIGNVGDSRAYLIRNGVCSQVTLDHSLIEEEIRAGNMTPDMATTSNLQSVITRAIGVADTVEPDLFEAKLQPRDMLLLASDGLTRYARAEEIGEMASKGSGLSNICQRLIDLAKQRGGEDNITCVLLHAVESPGKESVSTSSDALQAVQPNTPPDEMEAFVPTI
jgi:serine/threonine protein phosphatase PrpC